MLLNASYDASRELYRELSLAFADHWREQGCGEVVIRHTHGGSGKQARAVLDGLQADLLSLALSHDLDTIAKRSDLLDPQWKQRLPKQGSPWFSTVVMVVRAGNPKGIRDFDDLLRPDVVPLSPSPRISGGARWNYLALLAYFERKLGSEEQALGAVGEIFRRVPVLDAGARGAMNTFARREMGDVLLSWESEAFQAQKQLAELGLEIVVPSLSVKAALPVAMVDEVVRRRGSTSAAQGFLDFLFTPQAQQIALKHHFRVATSPALEAKPASPFDKGEKDSLSRIRVNGGKMLPDEWIVPLELLEIEDFGGWEQVSRRHFQAGGSFEQIFAYKTESESEALALEGRRK